MQRQALVQAEAIERNAILKKEMKQEEALAQAGVMIAEIKKGNIDA